MYSAKHYIVFFNAIRTNGTAYSYDAVDKITGEGIQIKSTSIVEDCTSFGPTSKWDKLYFVDFIPNGEIDGSVWFYEINSYDIYSIVLNGKRTKLFRDQQSQGRRPRFSIKSKIIKPNNLVPVYKINLGE